MTEKLFTPLKVGEFELEHRIMLELKFVTGRGTASFLADLPMTTIPGGLVIVDVTSLGDMSSKLWRQARQASVLEVRSREIAANKRLAGRTMLVRLRSNLSVNHLYRAKSIDELTQSDIRDIIASYVDTAKRARRGGFDGIELDASAGSIAHLFLMESTNQRQDCYGGSASGRIQFLLELIDALGPAIGRERVGVRLSPFSLGVAEGSRRATYEEVMSSLDDQEIAYLHIELGETGAAQALSMSPFAAALRRSYPGILFITGQQSLEVAIGLVERRWADGVCFKAQDIDAELVERLSRAQSRGDHL